MHNLPELVLGAGALGTAAFGIVEAAKWSPLGEAGFGQIPKLLGPLTEALRVAYGPDYKSLLRAQYRNRQGTEELMKTLRQGIRIGLKEHHAGDIARFLGVVEADALAQVVKALHVGQELSSEERNVLGRMELAVDARIESAIALALNRYVGAVRVAASGVAIVLAILAGWAIDADLIISLLVGVAAVPLAPIANDVVAALQAATKALKGRS